MCNEVARRLALGLVRDDLSELRIPLRFPEGAPNLEPLDRVRLTDRTLLLRRAGQGEEGAEGVMRRWSWPGPGGRPVYNFRSEGRRFEDGGAAAGRCLIPVDGFYEFTDSPADAPKRARKTRWLFRTDPAATGLDWFCLAGWWRREGDEEAFALLTCAPGPDMAPYHARQVVVPPADLWAGWLSGEVPAAEVCRPAPAGTLSVSRVD